MRLFLVSISLLLFIAPLGQSVPLAEKKDGVKKLVKIGKAKPLEWWQETVVYQIYPRSFQDSDGDGTGDLKGIISRADYFKDLGVEAVWISPIYESPMKDFGYDVSNFTNIDPLFGTLEDFRDLSRAFKERGIKLIMDFVPNHSSDLHPWFIASENGEEKYKDYYVWRDPKGFDEQGNPIVPNNWTSIFGGSMWEWSEKRQQFYLHQFIKEQPDLNFENRQVWNEILAALKFWLDMGVDGYRVDAVPHLFEDQRFLDEPVNPDRDPSTRPDEYSYYNHIYTNNLPEGLDFLAEMRQLLDIYTTTDGVIRCMMVEAAVPMDKMLEYYGTEKRPIAHFPFNFMMLDVRPENNATRVLELVDAWHKYMPRGQYWGSTMIGNHDNRRIPTKWTIGGIDAANMINILVHASSVSYNGEEIGMEDRWISWEDTRDPAGCNVGPDRYEETSRDPARTPMQWDSTKNAGFSTANRTWLPMNENYVTKNVELQNAAEESHLKVYKALIRLRKTDTWKYGGYTSFVLNNERVLGFIRNSVDENADPGSFVVLVNVGDSTELVDLSGITDSDGEQVPSEGTVLVRSVGFEDNGTTVGSQVSLRSLHLGPRNSIIVSYPHSA